MDLIPEFKKFAKKRAKEIKAMTDVQFTPETAQVNIAGQQLQFKLNVEQTAAWKLYVELNTRISTQPLSKKDGLLREALSSLYIIFGVTRDILKEAGPGVAIGPNSFGYYAMEILNQVLRPLLAKWHPKLLHWENQNKLNLSPFEHEKKWNKQIALRKEIEKTRKVIIEYNKSLAIIAGISK